MANKQVASYIREYLGKGYNRESITNSLLDQGFDLNSINAAFEEAYPTKMDHPFRQTRIDHSIMPSKKVELVLLGIFLIILVTGGLTYFTLNKAPVLVPTTTTTVRMPGTTILTVTTNTITPTTLKPNIESPTANFKAGDMRIISLKLCYSVSENFECDENANSEFKLGEPVYIHFKLVLKARMKYGSYVIGFTEDRVVYNEMAVQVDSLSSEGLMNVQREVSGEGLYTLPAYNLIETSTEDLAGNYKAVLVLKDKFSDEEIVKEITYKLV